MTARRRGLGVLLRGELRRLVATARRPTAAVWVGIVLPAVLLALGVLAVGRLGTAELSTAQGGITLGILLGGPVGFLAYGTLFRGADDSFLRRLGVEPGALYWERAVRLLGWGCGVAALAVIGYDAAAIGAGRVLTVALPAVVATWGAALLATSLAASAMAGRTGGQGWGCLTMGMWDREVAGAAPLVYAPLLPLVAGALAGGIVAGVDRRGVAAAVFAALGVLAAGAAQGPYVRALPRFAPQALEMSFAPPPAGDADGLRMRRGLARLLPRRAGAAWARDGAVASRRFAWASRATWPAVIFSLVALARWGTEPGTHVWVASAAGLVLVLQGAAVIGMGRMERRGARWIDRAVGITPFQRFLGRWAWGWGASLWLGVPLSLAWSWWAAAGAGWPWLLVGGGTSALASLASSAAAGRR